jgi:diguanylate cyclase (GGDEF)-like protein
LGFGLSILDAVRDYTLSAADFARTDIAIELLYLVEAKSAAMAASRRLNLRLQGARLAAEEAAITDSLTGLANRRAMERVLERLVQARAPFAVMQVDLDHFKPVNDGLGHAAGDALLAHVAQVLGQETRQDDLAARVGGDEFVLLFAGIAERARLSQIAERIQRRLAQPFYWGDVACKISASIGITIAGGDARPAPVLLAEADAALYAAKHAGRAQHAFHLAPPAQ